MAISWFCIGCLKDFDGEVPMDGKCSICTQRKDDARPSYNGNLLGVSPTECNQLRLTPGKSQ